MEKMGARSLAELVRMADKLGITYGPAQPTDERAAPLRD